MTSGVVDDECAGDIARGVEVAEVALSDSRCTEVGDEDDMAVEVVMNVEHKYSRKAIRCQ